MSVSYWDGGKEVSPPTTKAKEPVIASGILQTQYRPRSFLDNILVGNIKEGEVKHHINNDVVIPIPKEIHQQFSGYSRTKHRKLIEQWAKMNSLYYYSLIQEAKKVNRKGIRRKWVQDMKKSGVYKIRKWDKRSKKENLMIIAKWVRK